MRVPTIHSNGTSGEELLRQAQGATRALNHALEALQEAAPHGRDYYVQARRGDPVCGPDPSCEAYAEHQERVRKVREVRDEMMLISEGIADQLDEIARHKK